LLVALAALALHHGGWTGIVGSVLLLAGLAIVVRDLALIAAIERSAIALCAADGTKPQDIRAALDSMERRLALMRHRSDARNPATGLPTREHLFDGIDRDLAGNAGQRLLGVMRFSNYDQLAAFDPAGAAAAISQFARRFADATGDRHLIAQVDRDCIAIWFGQMDVADAERQMDALLYVAEQEIATPGGVISPRIETGIVRTSDDGGKSEQLLARALAVLSRRTAAPIPYAAPVETVRDMQEQFLIEQDLERAIAEDQLWVQYQPFVDLHGGRLVGAEALLRWRHPSLGPIPPSRFIPVVEEAGLADRYGLWVLDAACRQVRAWHDAGLKGIKVAVNLSARQLHDEALPLKIGRTLALHGLAPQSLELELTETAAMADIDRTRALFATLHDMGLSIAIDDFGAGYSSLSYLKNLRFDKLKIDREFVTDIDTLRDSRAICKALVELGRGLGLTVLAEGVETAAEVEALRELGCALFQGFYFARPLDGDGLYRLARDQAWQRTLRSPVHQRIRELERRFSA
jgi:EAL domain-containing protein (putative c-di-GMP-specific phosphodiesterase class I)/GGDEF domain-containing protein